LLSCLALGVSGQEARQRRSSLPATRASRSFEAQLTGLYRIDTARSDKLYTVVADASSNLPFREQQRFFIDLAMRLTPPDQFSIEQSGHGISIASSRAPRINFEADGILHTEKASDGHPVRTRAVLEDGQLLVSTNGSTDDKFSVSFEPIDKGQSLRVVRRIYAKELNEPVIIQSIYNKVSETAHWGIYGEPEAERVGSPMLEAAATKEVSPQPAARRSGGGAASELGTALERWVATTNRRDIRNHLSFYMPHLKAFYLARNVGREAVRTERSRAFERADLIEVRALSPETIFAENGQVAIMRFRKQYATKSGSQSHRGEVIQELRWQRTTEGWKIFSERDVRVLR
jgi:ketosteroid isomerase-like protein